MILNILSLFVHDEIQCTVSTQRYGGGANYFSLFVSYRFTSKQTHLTEFPE